MFAPFFYSFYLLDFADLLDGCLFYFDFTPFELDLTGEILSIIADCFDFYYIWFDLVFRVVGCCY